MSVKAITKDEVKGYVDYCTVGALKKFIEKHNIPDDAIVMIERVEDVYYEKHNWGVYRKEGDQCYQIKDLNRRMTDEIARRERGEDPQYPKIEDPNEFICEAGGEFWESMKTEYHPAWSPAFYSDDPDLLFINLHY